MILASFEGFLGSLWFAALVGVVSYLVGSVVPVGTLLSKFKK